MAHEAILDNLYDHYLPFRLYADFQDGVTVEELAQTYSLPVSWIRERLEAARLCIEKQVQIGVPSPPPDGG
jgi:Mor family transcriptional regulator